MPLRSNIRKWITGFSAVGGATLFYATDDEKKWIQKWDYDWDRHHFKWTEVSKTHTESETQTNGEKLINKSGDTKHHIILIRHGQYNTEGKTDADRTLTAVGIQQAEATGKRLQELGLPYTLIVQSKLTRAKETAQIIRKYLKNVRVEEDPDLSEGIPIEPDPSCNIWIPPQNVTEDGIRIEKAFRKYFHRPDSNQNTHSYTILVCHANVIRYLVCRALQLPPQGWIRLSLNHGSITCISIRASGRVTLMSFGNYGHMKPELISSQ